MPVTGHRFSIGVLHDLMRWDGDEILGVGSSCHESEGVTADRSPLTAAENISTVVMHLCERSTVDHCFVVVIARAFFTFVGDDGS